MDFERAPSNAVVLIEAINIVAQDLASIELWHKALQALDSLHTSGAARVHKTCIRA